jgi:phosphoribosylamine--glycine ligase
VTRIYCAPGNAGIGELAELVALTPDDVHGLRRFAEQEHIDLTIVGPELPLSLGLVDEFEAHRLRVFGPNRQAAQLEASKAFAKEIIMQGVLSIQAGNNPRVVEMQLMSFLSNKAQASIPKAA